MGMWTARVNWYWTEPFLSITFINFPATKYYNIYRILVIFGDICFSSVGCRFRLFIRPWKWEKFYFSKNRKIIKFYSSVKVIPYTPGNTTCKPIGIEHCTAPFLCCSLQYYINLLINNLSFQLVWFNLARCFLRTLYPFMTFIL